MNRSPLINFTLLFIVLILGCSIPFLNSSDGIIPEWRNYITIANNKCVGELVDNNFTFSL